MFFSGTFSLYIDGYSTKDIAYRWRDGAIKSVSLHKDVQLPQFNVQGYRTKERLIILSTGKLVPISRCRISKIHIRNSVNNNNYIPNENYNDVYNELSSAAL